MALVTIAVAAVAQPADAKELRPAPSACWQLGQWRGTVAAGITDVRVIGQQEAAVWRAFQPIQAALPRAAWRAFDQRLTADGLVRFCRNHYPNVYARGRASGAAIQPGFVRDGSCNIYRSDDGILFVHQRAHIDTPQEHAVVETERQTCANAGRAATSTSSPSGPD